MGNVLNKFNDLEIGDRITLKIEDYFGSIHTAKATLIKKPYHHGYISPSGGGWGFCKIDEDERPCYEVWVKFYRQKIPRVCKLEFHIKDVRKGWEEA